jgi:hypothetical protein
MGILCAVIFAFFYLHFFSFAFVLLHLSVYWVYCIFLYICVCMDNSFLFRVGICRLRCAMRLWDTSLGGHDYSTLNKIMCLCMGYVVQARYSS